ncbi:acyl-CoA dehydrogenase family protein [Nocardia sp. alder85J]|uniref:acyl-CoA dehydrogenase family protein n=1 Tax=Nocardia sp. alder85J TaxID=2862949 RepID=UPI001CD658A7|nr:acyl-CoA dehydrogenase family protein [Nocardia sp. alder85J]MCX4090943.1 acyl-CoA/acyl-ACP dehydrogenase [Nocardia sp. alder85J]
MTLIDTPEQQALADAVRRFVTERTPRAAVRETAFGPTSFDPAVWRGLAADLGLAGLLVPDEFGGQGGTAADLAVALRELGAGLVPAPLLASGVLAAGTLLALDDVAAQKTWLPQLSSGAVVATLAVSEPDGREWISDRPATTAMVSAGAVTLSGIKSAVLHAADADLLLVTATGPDGAGIYLVERGAAGLLVHPENCLDATKSLATVSFDGTPVTPLTGDTAAALEQVADLANLAVAAEQVGALRACLDLTTEYARIRFSFGHPIGAYQGVKHRLADIYTDWALADAAVRRAAEAAATDPAAFPAAAATARVVTSPAYVNAAKHTMLLHGGIGFTWEHDAHLYYRHAIVSNVLFGGPDYQKDRLADKLAI